MTRESVPSFSLTFGVNIHLECLHMYKFIKSLIKLALLLLAIALVFDLHYQGQSIRALAKEYGVKVTSWLYEQGKSLVGKDLKDLTPSSLPKLENTLKSLENSIEGDGKKDNVKKNLEGNKDQSKRLESQKANEAKLDQLTPEDRAKLKELLDQKIKAKPKTSSL